MRKIKVYSVYVPLILIEIYLNLTLLLYAFGPIKWKTYNPIEFWSYIFLYQVFFIFGYISLSKKNNISTINIESSKQINKFILKYLWLILVIALVVLVIKYMGFFQTYEVIPWNLPSDFIKGLINPGEQYRLKALATSINGYTGNKFTAIIYALFAFVGQSIIPIFVFLWDQIRKSYKIFFLFLILFDFAIFVSGGTNKGIFDLLFIFASTLTVFFIINFSKKPFISLLNTRKVLIGVTLFLMIFSFWYFSWTMTSRVGSIAIYTANLTNDVEINALDESNDVEINALDESNDVEINALDESNDIIQITGNDSFTTNLLYGLSSYICQGYYGMSLSLGEDFTSTFGIGNSQFLTTNFKYFFNIDVQPLTYQAKITDRWDQYAQWHSFYSYMANDFSFPGVILIMYLLGASLAMIYKDATFGNNIVAQSILPLYAIIFLYMPANNQVFTFLASFCAFFELIILWILSRKLKSSC